MNQGKDHKCIDPVTLLGQTKINIEKFGLQVIMVQATSYSPSFAYSIGLYKTYQHPEIICFGLPTDLGHAIINDVADLVEKGEKIQSLTNYDNIFKNGKAIFLEVDKRNITDYFAAAINFYETRTFPAL